MLPNDFCVVCFAMRYDERLEFISGPEATQHLNCRDHEQGLTPLHIAVRENNEPLLICLLEHPLTNPNLYDLQHKTPLLLAIENQRTQLALRLVRNSKCSVNARDRKQSTALMYAVRLGDVHLAHEILKKGVDDINAQDNYLCTALHYSCCNVSCEMLDLLLYYGADPSIRNLSNETFFMCFLMCPHPTKRLSEYQRNMIDFETDMNEINTRGVSTLFLAIKSETPVVEEIINRGADVNYFTEDCNALRLSLEVFTSLPFDLIWPRFNYNYVYSYVEMPLLCNLFHDYILEDWLHRFQTVCSSDIIEHAIQHYIFENLPPIISETVRAFLRREYTERDFFPYICVLLSYGANLFLEDLETIYIYCGGDNDTINTLLDMEIKLHYTMFLSQPYVMLMVAEEPEAIFNNYNFPSSFNKIAEQVKFLPRLFQFCTPTETFISKLRLVRDRVARRMFPVSSTLKQSVRTAYTTVIDSLRTELCSVPSLLELSRNNIRRLVCQKHYTIDYPKYKNLIYRLGLPKTIVNILLFKLPVNNIEINIPQFTITGLSTQLAI